MGKGSTVNKGAKGAQNRKKKQRQKARARALYIALASVIGIALLSVAAYFANGWLERRSYSLAYAETITAQSAEFGLEPYLVAAVIHCESGGDPYACSPKGARGLMQIMPATGEWIAGKLGMPDYSEEMLEDAQVNIRMGCWYLSYLLGVYDGNTDLALAAYNAGPGNVKKWLGDPEYSQDGALVKIPFAETETYVKRVNAAQRKYRELYDEKLIPKG